MKKERKINKFGLFFSLLCTGIMIGLFLCNTAFIYASEDDEKNVLFISSYSESFITVPDQIKGLQSVFDQENVTLQIEYMDTKRYAADENTNNFYVSLKYKLENGPHFDAIIVGDDAALQFAMDYQEELFLDIPIVFFGINDRERANTADAKPNMAGCIEETSLVENIKIANRFNPNAKNVVAIVDGTLTGQGDQKQFEAAASSFDNLEFQILNVSDHTFGEFAKILKEINEDTILLFLSMNQDISEEYLNLDKQVQFIKEHTDVPVYRASVGGVGEGLIGGKMIAYEQFGKNAADLCMDIFSGTSIESIALVEETPYYYYFDYDIIKKYNIKESSIPKNAVLLNKEMHPLEKYKKYIIGTLVFVAFLIILAVILIIDNIKRRKMQKELKDSHEELTAIYEELAASEEELQQQYNMVEKNANEVKSLYQKYNIAIKSTDSAVWELNIDTKELEISENINQIVNKVIQTSGNMNMILDDFLHVDYIEGVLSAIDRCIMGVIEEINIKAPIIEDDSVRRWILIRGKGIMDSKGDLKKIYGIFLDITTMKEQEEYIEYYANHDYLTHLPNRMNFMDKLHGELKSGSRGAILLFDMDDFKSINDTLGHVYGDELLKEIAIRLKHISDDHMFIARLGGDEFLILLMGVSTREEVDQYIHKIRTTFSDAFSIEGKENYVNFSMGITFYPQDSDNINQLIMNADTAMYSVKHNGKNNFSYYHEDMRNVMRTKKEVESILRHAVKEDGFCLFYQPQVEAQTGDIIGFEALLRLKEHTIGPGVFIPVAEETGHIIEIGRWIAKEAIAQIADWRAKGFTEKVIAINYSSKQLRDIGYIDYIRQLLHEYQVKPEYLEIEITEGILLENNLQTMEFLQELKKYGFKIALDDFGTGYSSLNYLTYIPVDKIKLDKTINDKFLALENTKVMDSIISLAHSLNLKITAEGIEEWDKFLKLKQSGCDYIQGYLFSKPLKVDEVEKLYDENLIDKLQRNSSAMQK